MQRLYKLLWIAAAVLLVGFLTLSPYAAIKARAAPALASREECMVFADMMLAARALYEEGLSQTQVARLIAVMYAIQDERQARLAQLVVVHTKTSTKHPRESAMEFFHTCDSQQGNVDSILGKTL